MPRTLLISILLVLLSGCVHMEKWERDHEWYFYYGEMYHDSAHRLLPKMDVDEIKIRIPAFTLIVVPDDFWVFHKGKSKMVRGACWSDIREIKVVGRRLNGKYALNPNILGHELEHLINHTDGRFINPDEKY